MKLLREQDRLLNLQGSNSSLIESGPLSRLLVRGRIDMLSWFLTIHAKRHQDRNMDGRVLKMLQKQKDLFARPMYDKRPSQTSKLTIQGRIEILEWLLVDD